MRPLIALSFAFLPVLLFGQNLSQIESIEFDPVNGQWLISNNNTVVAQSYSGELSNFGSASADYGMEVMGDTLYAINLAGNGWEIRCFDLNSGESVGTIDVVGPTFANGLASDGVNRLWMTDFSGERIYEVDASDIGTATYQVVANLNVTPNGITYDPLNDRCIFVTWGANAGIYEMTLPDYSVNLLTTTGLTNIDGIDINENGECFIAAWQPDQVRKYTSDFSSSETLSIPGLNDAADICYSTEVDSLAIPNSGNNTVTIVGFGTTDVLEHAEAAQAFEVFPNPLTPASVIYFDLLTAAEVNFQCHDSKGRLIWEWGRQNLPVGQHRILLSSINFPSGNLHLTMWQDGRIAAQRGMAVSE